MSRPVVGIVGNSFLVEGQYPVHGSGTMNTDAIADVAGAVPLIFPGKPEHCPVDKILGICDGILLTGGRPNVHPEEYGEVPTEAHGTFDRGRDRTALPLIRACVERGQPVLGICRGFQEFNVAFGGTLHPEIRELPGRMNHRMPPDGTIDEKFALRHKVTFDPGSIFVDVFGDEVVTVNSLHGQGIKAAGPRVRIEGCAEDGTPEAIRIDGATGFALAVQWHPEYQAAENSVSRALFESFGKALTEWCARKRSEGSADSS